MRKNVIINVKKIFGKHCIQLDRFGWDMQERLFVLYQLPWANVTADNIDYSVYIYDYNLKIHCKRDYIYIQHITHKPRLTSVFLNFIYEY